MPRESKVVISILNWNASQATLACLASLRAMPVDAALDIEIVVLDNGSSAAEWQLLEQGVDRSAVTLLREPANLGFAGGHNVALRMAARRGVDFVWLLNNDAVVFPTTLYELVTLMDSDPGCGAASPVISAMHDDSIMDFCGAMHDWPQLETRRAANVEQLLEMERRHPQEMWVVGTAVLFRMRALAQAGLLDERLFAYYEDDDIGVRLAAHGWRSRVAPAARLRHACYGAVVTERPPYYFYLMARNGFRFWLAHTPPAHRRFIRLRLLDKALFVANRLRRKGLHEKANACLLGIVDGLAGKSGPPQLTRRPSALLGVVRNLFWCKQYRWLKRLIP